MKFLTEAIWNKLNFLEPHHRFFVEAYFEKLNLFTPHFYQARMMNSVSASKEVLQMLKEYSRNEKALGTLQMSVEELTNCLSQEDSHPGHFLSHVRDCGENIRKTEKGEVKKHLLLRMELICRAIINRQTTFDDEVWGCLKKALEKPYNASKAETTLREINDLTGQYLTCLLNRGFFPTYLFNRLDYFTQPLRYGQRDFVEQFSFVTEKLNTALKSYEIYFCCKADNADSLVSTLSDGFVVFLRVFPSEISDPKVAIISKGTDWNLVAMVNMESSDYESAAWRAKDILNSQLDTLSLFSNEFDVAVCDRCASILRMPGTHHLHIIDLKETTRFLSDEIGVFYSDLKTQVPTLIAKLDPDGKENLYRSLRYLRLARNAENTEQKLLNLWIALESLFVADETSIIQNIQNFVPEVYAITSLERRVDYLKGLLGKNRVAPTPKVTAHLGKTTRFNRKTSRDVVFQLLRNEDAIVELFMSLAPKEHLKFRILAVFQDLKTNKSILDRIERSEQDIMRQLRRIYFLRNKIAHTGHFSNVRPQIISHLLDYLSICYLCIIRSASSVGNSGQYSIYQLMVGYKMGCETVLSGLRSPNQVQHLSELKPVSFL